MLRYRATAIRRSLRKGCRESAIEPSPRDGVNARTCFKRQSKLRFSCDSSWWQGRHARPCPPDKISALFCWCLPRCRPFLFGGYNACYTIAAAMTVVVAWFGHVRWYLIAAPVLPPQDQEGTGNHHRHCFPTVWRYGCFEDHKPPLPNATGGGGGVMLVVNCSLYRACTHPSL